MTKGLKVFPIEIHYEKNGSLKGKCVISVRAVKLEHAQRIAEIQFRMKNWNTDTEQTLITDVKVAA